MQRESWVLLNTEFFIQSYLLTVPFNTIQTAISKFVSQFKVNNAYGKIHFLLNASFKRLFLYSVLGAIIFLLISPFLANFLHVPLHPVWVVSLFLFFALLLPRGERLLYSELPAGF